MGELRRIWANTEEVRFIYRNFQAFVSALQNQLEEAPPGDPTLIERLREMLRVQR